MSHDVLAAVVEVISGKKFSEYVRQNIFEPLEMNESYYHNEGVQNRMAELYRYVNTSQLDLVHLQASNNNKNDGSLIHESKDVDFVFGCEYDSGGAAGATVLVDPELKLSMFYTHHMLNPHEEYYQPRLRNVLYSCL